jgi:hypothetical protein
MEPGYGDRGRHEQGAAAVGVRPAKTSAAAAFALIFGVVALFSALTALLAPLAVVFGVLAIILGFVGMRMASHPGITGKGVAIGGLVLGVLGLLLGAVLVAGAVTVLNDDRQVDRIERELDRLRDNLPTEVPTPR